MQPVLIRNQFPLGIKVNPLRWRLVTLLTGLQLYKPDITKLFLLVYIVIKMSY